MSMKTLSLAFLGLKAGAVGAFLIALPLTMSGAKAEDNVADAISADIEAYCTNIADEARDRRYLLQKAELDKLQADIEERIGALEERKAEYEDWLGRRNEFLDRAEAGLVEIYKGMRPDAAAERLEQVNAEIAAAIIMKLSPRTAGEILNEMDTQIAAMLTTVIAAAADETTSRNPS